MSEKNFFIESAFGEIYEGTFFADDFPKAPQNNSERNKTPEDAQINEATSKVRMPTEVEVSQQVTGKLNSMYALGGNLGGIAPLAGQTFNGVILGGI